jgi:hypothetical protein
MRTIREPDDEPMWDLVGVSSCDFRPHFDGNLIHLFSCVTPERTAHETEAALADHTREIARWVLSHQNEFSPGDRFQIILGWPKSIRQTARQIIKTGGDFEALSSIAGGTTRIIPRPGWSREVFEETTGEPGQEGPGSNS